MDYKVKMQSKVAENPFYRKVAMKNLLNNAKTAGSKEVMDSLLESAWHEAKDLKETREGFFTIIFSIGDISNRQHNLFGKTNVDNGGHAARPQFMWIMSWLRKKIPTQYYKFMFSGIINEFVSWFVLLASQVRTLKGKSSINNIDTNTYSALGEHDLKQLAQYVASVLNGGTDIDRMMLAKWLVLPRFSKRQKANREGVKNGNRPLQKATVASMNVRANFLRILSEIMNWEIIEHPKNIQFVGLKQFKKEYNRSLESVLFSTKRIVGMDKEQFFKLLDSSPAGARYRIQRRLMNKEGVSKNKWFNKQTKEDLSVWFKGWESFKEEAQQEERVIKEKLRTRGVSLDSMSSMDSIEDQELKIKLEEVKKKAKVNVGGSSLFDEINALLEGRGNDTLIHSLLNKIKFEVPILVVADCSGSMGMNGGLPMNIARLLATVTMLKNPSKEVDNLLIGFGTRCDVWEDGVQAVKKTNRFMEGETVTIDKLVDRTKPFNENFLTISRILNPVYGGTDLTTVSKQLSAWINADASLKQVRMEHLQTYPVIVVISDGEFNSHYGNPAHSLSAFMQDMKHLGWEGIVVVWDVLRNEHSSRRSGEDKLAGIDNVFHYYGYNLGVINQIFANLHDLDVIDVYTELKSIWKSNRYEVIRTNTL